MAERLPIALNTAFGRLTVLRAADPRPGPGNSLHYWYWVRCSCGAELEVRKNSLTGGNTRSCGCLKRELDRTTRHVIHGLAKTRAHRSWLAMRRRCAYPSDPSYRLYGGRGIKVCERWKSSFENFYVDMGECPEGHSIDRIDNDGNYEPDNCRWATRRQQAANQRTNRLVSLDGETLPVRHAAERLGVSSGSVYCRVRTHGETHQQAIDHYATARHGVT